MKFIFNLSGTHLLNVDKIVTLYRDGVLGKFRVTMTDGTAFFISDEDADKLLKDWEKENAGD